jgi:hypothetical protein
MSDNNKEYEEFFEKIKIFKKKKEKQKLRGINDYNILTAVLRADDEVKLHSRMIGSLLNPYGKHYQGTLFIEKFLDILKLNDFKMNLNKLSVEIEHNGIDIYITDGKKHIIIENKIWAIDQPCQIIRYINSIVTDKDNKNIFLNLNENDIIDENILRVIYLTPRDKEKPDDHILEEQKGNNYISFSGDTDKLQKCAKEYKLKILKNYKVFFKKIGYKDEIQDWLIACEEQVHNITNLNAAIQEYKAVVNIIIGSEYSKLEPLENIIYKDDMLFALSQDIYKNKREDLFANREDNFYGDICYSYEQARKKVVHNFFEKEFIRFLEDEKFDVVLKYTNNGNPLIEVKKNKNKMIFGFKTNRNKGYYEINKDEKIDMNKNKKIGIPYYYPNDPKSINAYFLDKGKRAKEDYLKIIQDNL